MSVTISFTIDDVQWEASQQGEQISQKEAKAILQEIDDMGWLSAYNVQIMRYAYKKYKESKEQEARAARQRETEHD